MSELLNDLLAVPTSSHKPKRTPVDRDYTSQIEVTSSSVNVTLNGEPGKTTEGTAREFLEREGLDPDAWEVTSFARSEWGDPDSPKESVKFTFKPRKSAAEASKVDIEELVSYLDTREPVGPSSRPANADAMIVALGDMQYGNADKDGAQGQLSRTLECLDLAAEQVELHHPHHVHVAWLGDHVEGFNSQNGGNVWRTTLTITEQIRLTRKVMTYAMTVLYPLASRLTMAAIPGNHGIPLKVAGKMATRYDDSYDTEALIAVSEAAAMSEHYKDVEFYVPETDEMTVLLDVGGLNVAHVHGHQWRPSKHFDWWKGQSFNQDSSMHVADVLLAGHLHHTHIQEDGKRLFVQVPSMTAESTWFRHSTGTGGAPGLLTLTVANGEVESITPVRGTVTRGD